MGWPQSQAPEVSSRPDGNEVPGVQDRPGTHNATGKKNRSCQEVPPAHQQNPGTSFSGVVGLLPMFYPQFLLYSSSIVRPDQEGAAREGELDVRGRAGIPDLEEGPHILLGPPRPRHQLPLCPIHRRLRYLLGSGPFPDQGRTGASRGLYQPQALPRGNKVCGIRKGGPGHKVGSTGAEVLPLGPPFHPCYGPRTTTVDVKGEGYQRPSDVVVPDAPGLPLPGATSLRGRPRECGRTLP